MEKYRVQIKDTNGDEHNHVVDAASDTELYLRIIQSPDGWYRYRRGSQMNFVQVKQITYFSVQPY